MATQYHVYKNDGAGGLVNYASIVATTASLTYTGSALALGSDTTFAVRAFDTVTGYEEKNVDAVVRIVVDPAGADITARPNPPDGLIAVPTANASARIRFTYNPAGQGGAPTSFKVWCQQGGSVNYNLTPTTTIPYTSGVFTYTYSATSLVDGATYTVAVRATNAKGDELNVNVVQFVADATGPNPPDNLTATVTSVA